MSNSAAGWPTWVASSRMSTAAMVSTPTSSQRVGVRRTTAAPTVRHPSAVSRLAARSPVQPIPATAARPSMSGTSSKARRRLWTTATTAIAASTGVAIIASTARPIANGGSASTPKVPTMSAAGPAAAPAGGPGRVRRSRANGLGSATSAPSIVASAMYALTPETSIARSSGAPGRHARAIDAQAIGISRRRPKLLDAPTLLEPLSPRWWCCTAVDLELGRQVSLERPQEGAQLVGDDLPVTGPVAFGADLGHDPVAFHPGLQQERLTAGVQLGPYHCAKRLRFDRCSSQGGDAGRSHVGLLCAHA